MDEIFELLLVERCHVDGLQLFTHSRRHCACMRCSKNAGLQQVGFLAPNGAVGWYHPLTKDQEAGSGGGRVPALRTRADDGRS